MSVAPHNSSWGLILGGSSGIGLATAKKLASHGLNLIVVHRDKRSAMAKVEEDFAEIRSFGIQFHAMNSDALDRDSRRQLLDSITDILKGGRISLFLHSIARGNLKPAAPRSTHEETSILDEDDYAQTIYNMGTSLMFWVQDLHQRKLLAADTRVLGLTSEGNKIAWPGYAAVSAAKAALEAVMRSIATEFASHGIRCNVLQPGVTDTPALRLIPGNEELKSRAVARNPFQRLTTPEDVANVVYLLSLKEAAWINGSLIRVDGGEAIRN